MATVVFVEEDRCTGCGSCVAACPHDAIYLEDGKAHVRTSRCAGCELCVDACPENALYAVREPAVPMEAPQAAVRSDQAARAIQPRSAWVTGLGAAILVAQRILPAVVNLIGALQAHGSEPSQTGEVGIAPVGRGAGGCHGGRRFRNRRGSRR